jgi:hypothetical protein
MMPGSRKVAGEMECVAINPPQPAPTTNPSASGMRRNIFQAKRIKIKYKAKALNGNT